MGSSNSTAALLADIVGEPVAVEKRVRERPVRHITIVSGSPDVALAQEPDNVLSFAGELLVIEAQPETLVVVESPEFTRRHLADVLDYCDFSLVRARDLLLYADSQLDDAQDVLPSIQKMTDEDFRALTRYYWVDSWHMHLNAVLGDQGNAETLEERHELAQGLIEASGTPEIWMGDLLQLLETKYVARLQRREKKRLKALLADDGRIAAIEAELAGLLPAEQAA